MVYNTYQMVNKERFQLTPELTEPLEYQSKIFCQEMAKRGIFPQEMLLPDETPTSIGSFTIFTPETLDQPGVISSFIFISETEGNESTGIIADCFGSDKIDIENLSPDRRIMKRFLKNEIFLVADLYKMKPLEGENYWAGLCYFSDNPEETFSCCFFAKPQF